MSSHPSPHDTAGAAQPSFPRSSYPTTPPSSSSDAYRLLSRASTRREGGPSHSSQTTSVPAQPSALSAHRASPAASAADVKPTSASSAAQLSDFVCTGVCAGAHDDSVESRPAGASADQPHSHVLPVCARDVGASPPSAVPAQPTMTAIVTPLDARLPATAWALVLSYCAASDKAVLTFRSVSRTLNRLFLVRLANVWCASMDERRELQRWRRLCRCLTERKVSSADHANENARGRGGSAGKGSTDGDEPSASEDEHDEALLAFAARVAQSVFSAYGAAPRTSSFDLAELLALRVDRLRQRESSWSQWCRHSVRRHLQLCVRDGAPLLAGTFTGEGCLMEGMGRVLWEAVRAARSDVEVLISEWLATAADARRLHANLRRGLFNTTVLPVSSSLAVSPVVLPCGLIIGMDPDDAIYVYGPSQTMLGNWGEGRCIQPMKHESAEQAAVREKAARRHRRELMSRAYLRQDVTVPVVSGLAYSLLYDQVRGVVNVPQRMYGVLTARFTQSELTRALESRLASPSVFAQVDSRTGGTSHQGANEVREYICGARAVAEYATHARAQCPAPPRFLNTPRPIVERISSVNMSSGPCGAAFAADVVELPRLRATSCGGFAHVGLTARALSKRADQGSVPHAMTSLVTDRGFVLHASTWFCGLNREEDECSSAVATHSREAAPNEARRRIKRDRKRQWVHVTVSHDGVREEELVAPKSAFATARDSSDPPVVELFSVPLDAPAGARSIPTASQRSEGVGSGRSWSSWETLRPHDLAVLDTARARWRKHAQRGVAQAGELGSSPSYATGEATQAHSPPDEDLSVQRSDTHHAESDRAATAAASAGDAAEAREGTPAGGGGGDDDDDDEDTLSTSTSDGGAFASDAGAAVTTAAPSPASVSDNGANDDGTQDGARVSTSVFGASHPLSSSTSTDADRYTTEWPTGSPSSAQALPSSMADLPQSRRWCTDAEQVAVPSPSRNPLDDAAAAAASHEHGVLMIYPPSHIQSRIEREDEEVLCAPRKVRRPKSSDGGTADRALLSVCNPRVSAPAGEAFSLSASEEVPCLRRLVYASVHDAPVSLIASVNYNGTVMLEVVGGSEWQPHATVIGSTGFIGSSMVSILRTPTFTPVAASMAAAQVGGSDARDGHPVTRRSRAGAANVDSAASGRRRTDRRGEEVREETGEVLLVVKLLSESGPGISVWKCAVSRLRHRYARKESTVARVLTTPPTGAPHSHGTRGQPVPASAAWTTARCRTTYVVDDYYYFFKGGAPGSISCVWTQPCGYTVQLVVPRPWLSSYAAGYQMRVDAIVEKSARDNRQTSLDARQRTWVRLLGTADELPLHGVSLAEEEEAEEKDDGGDDEKVNAIFRSELRHHSLSPAWRPELDGHPFFGAAPPFFVSADAYSLHHPSALMFIFQREYTPLEQLVWPQVTDRPSFFPVFAAQVAGAARLEDTDDHHDGHHDDHRDDGAAVADPGHDSVSRPQQHEPPEHESPSEPGPRAGVPLEKLLGDITAIAVSPDHAFFVVAGRDGHILLVAPQVHGTGGDRRVVSEATAACATITTAASTGENGNTTRLPSRSTSVPSVSADDGPSRDAVMHGVGTTHEDTEGSLVEGFAGMAVDGIGHTDELFPRRYGRTEVEEAAALAGVRQRKHERLLRGGRAKAHGGTEGQSRSAGSPSSPRAVASADAEVRGGDDSHLRSSQTQDSEAAGSLSASQEMQLRNRVFSVEEVFGSLCRFDPCIAHVEASYPCLTSPCQRALLNALVVNDESSLADYGLQGSASRGDGHVPEEQAQAARCLPLYFTLLKAPTWRVDKEGVERLKIGKPVDKRSAPSLWSLAGMAASVIDDEMRSGVLTQSADSGASTVADTQGDLANARLARMSTPVAVITNVQLHGDWLMTTLNDLADITVYDIANINPHKPRQHGHSVGLLYPAAVPLYTISHFVKPVSQLCGYSLRHLSRYDRVLTGEDSPLRTGHKVRAFSWQSGVLVVRLRPSDDYGVNICDFRPFFRASAPSREAGRKAAVSHSHPHCTCPRTASPPPDTMEARDHTPYGHEHNETHEATVVSAEAARSRRCCSEPTMQVVAVEVSRSHPTDRASAPSRTADGDLAEESLVSLTARAERHLIDAHARAQQRRDVVGVCLSARRLRNFWAVKNGEEDEEVRRRRQAVYVAMRHRAAVRDPTCGNNSSVFDELVAAVSPALVPRVQHRQSFRCLSWEDKGLRYLTGFAAMCVVVCAVMTMVNMDYARYKMPFTVLFVVWLPVPICEIYRVCMRFHYRLQVELSVMSNISAITAAVLRYVAFPLLVALKWDDLGHAHSNTNDVLPNDPAAAPHFRMPWLAVLSMAMGACALDILQFVFIVRSYLPACCHALVIVLCVLLGCFFDHVHPDMPLEVILIPIYLIVCLCIALIVNYVRSKLIASVVSLFLVIVVTVPVASFVAEFRHYWKWRMQESTDKPSVAVTCIVIAIYAFIYGISKLLC